MRNLLTHRSAGTGYGRSHFARGKIGSSNEAHEWAVAVYGRSTQKVQAGD